MTRLRRSPTDDTGASLILALAFMTFLGLVVSALLTYTGTSLRSTSSTKIKAQSTYDIDGALQAAVNKVRADGTFTNAPAGPACPKLDFPGPNTGSNIAVACVGGDGTGAAGGGMEINPSNRPAYGLLTLGTGSEIGIQKGSNNVLSINGDTYVNSTPISIDQSGTACAITALPPAPPAACSGTWVQSGSLTARGTCGGTVVAAAGVNCSPANPVVPDPAVGQPAQYAQPAGPLTYQAVPACGPARTLAFNPGYYDDAVALNKLTDGTCPNKTLHFTPGVYYFDFHNGEVPLPAGLHVWTIQDETVKVVGGTPQGWSPVTIPVIPGACVSPLVSATNGGVEFVFGGDSRVDVKLGDVELCGSYSASAPPIVIYGAKSGTDVQTGPLTAKPDGSGVTSGPAFTPVAKTIEADSDPATAVIAGGAGDVTSEVTLFGFSPPTLPPGSILKTAELVVRHRDNNATGSTLKALQVQFTPKRAGAAATAYALTPYLDGPGGTAYHDDVLDVTAALRDEVHKFGLNKMDVTYSATVGAGNTVTENLDSIQLKLTWKPPTVRAQTATVNGASNCVGAVGGCAFIKTIGPKTRFHLQGTAYAPRAMLDLQLTNASAQVFRVGLIIRTLKIQITASAALANKPMIDVPPIAPAGAAVPLEVYFRAYVCPPGQSMACSANPAPAAPWRLSGTARARYENLGGATPSYGKVTVLGWTVRST